MRKRSREPASTTPALPTSSPEEAQRAPVSVVDSTNRSSASFPSLTRMHTRVAPSPFNVRPATQPAVDGASSFLFLPPRHRDAGVATATGTAHACASTQRSLAQLHSALFAPIAVVRTVTAEAESAFCVWVCGGCFCGGSKCQMGPFARCEQPCSLPLSRIKTRPLSFLRTNWCGRVPCAHCPALRHGSLKIVTCPDAFLCPAPDPGCPGAPH
jgi:hypothetical protein